MQTTILEDVRQVSVQEHPDAAIEEPTDAVVRVTAACVCGSDLWSYRGINDITTGSTIGHEAVGVVEEVGSEVRDTRVGDFVVIPFVHCDNTCPHCRNGATSACQEQGFTTTGQGELVRVTHADGSCVRTDGTPDADLLPSLLALTDVMATGWHAAVSAGVRQGGTAVVVGDGAVGLCAVLACRELGAERIVAMSRHEPRQALARRFGATDVVAERGDEATEKVRELTDGIGADSVLECVGTGESMTSAFAFARPGSTVGFVGVPHGVELPVRRMFGKNVGLAGGLAPVRTYLPDLLERVQDGRIEPGLVFDARMPLSEVAEAYRAMDERRAIKVMLDL